MVNIGNEWGELLKGEFDKEYYLKLRQFLISEYSQYKIYPNMYNIFNALKYTSYSDVKAVILGQDPYHQPGQAQGLCFSVQKGTPQPPSLQNIFKEIQLDLGKPIPPTGDLTRWAEQGVLLLNATLTVRAHQAASHQRRGWETFTDAAIRAISAGKDHVVFILWGGYARSKASFIDRSKHLILESVHPSPLSANRGGWFGNHHFSRCNQWLVEHGEQPIEW